MPTCHLSSLMGTLQLKKYVKICELKKNKIIIIGREWFWTKKKHFFKWTICFIQGSKKSSKLKNSACY